MGCGPSTIPEDRRRPHDGGEGPNSRSQGLLPGLDKLIRLSTQNLSEEPRSRKVSASHLNAPNLQRPRQEKDELIPDVSVFAKRDKWAEKVPSEHCTSVQNLARYLTHEASSDLEKARAFYRWMAINICYDVESFLTKTHVYPSDPESVLKYRITVCDGYAQLFDALCKASSVPCYYVAGFSKGTAYDPDVPITEESFVNHAWNVVCIDGEWWPCDVTWGAGYMDKSNKFLWHYNELNFLCDPEIFILAHFPFMEDSHEYSAPFQLLKHPISLKDFNVNVKPDRNGMEWGLHLLSHTNSIIEVERDVTIKFQARKVTMTNISCDFHTKRSKLDFERNVLLYKKDGVFIAKVKPPGEGEYKLMLYGETEGMAKHQGLVSYIINCTKADDNPSPYPNHFGLWGGQPIAVDSGFRDEILETNVFISDDGNLHFSLPLKRSVDTIIKLEHTEKSNDLGDFVTEASNSSMMVIMARLPYSGYYKLHLYANDPNGGGNSYIPVAFFMIKCISGNKSSAYTKADAQQFLEQEKSRPRTKKKVPQKISTPPEQTDEDDENEDDTQPSRVKQDIPAISVPPEDRSRRSSRYENEAPQRKISRQGSPEPDRDQEELVLPSSRRGSNASVASKRSVSRAPSPTPSAGYARDSDPYHQNLYEHEDRVRKSSRQEDPSAAANLYFGQNYNQVRYDPYTKTHVPAPVLAKSTKAESEEEDEDDDDDEESDNKEDDEEEKELSNLKKDDTTEEDKTEEEETDKDDDGENDDDDKDTKDRSATDRRISHSRSPHGSRSTTPVHERRPSYARSPAGSRSGSPQIQDPRHYPTAVYDPYTGQMLQSPSINGHSRYEYDPYLARSPAGSRETSPGYASQGYQTSLNNQYQTSSYLSPEYSGGYQYQQGYSSMISPSSSYRSVISPRTTHRPY